MKTAYTTDETIAVLNVSRQTLWKYEKKGRITTEKRRNKKYYINDEKFQLLLKNKPETESLLEQYERRIAALETQLSEVMRELRELKSKQLAENNNEIAQDDEQSKPITKVDKQECQQITNVYAEEKVNNKVLTQVSNQSKSVTQVDTQECQQVTNVYIKKDDKIVTVTSTRHGENKERLFGLLICWNKSRRYWEAKKGSKINVYIGKDKSKAQEKIVGWYQKRGLPIPKVS